MSRELSQRQKRRIRTSLRLSNLPPGMTLSDFDFGFQPSIDWRQIETLATCAFIREHVSLLLQGPPGVGDTHVGVGLGVAAIEHGFSVAFYLLEELLHENATPRVKRWRDVDMRKRRCTAGLLRAESKFRRVKGSGHMSRLLKALESIVLGQGVDENRKVA